jgi:hypothetical protein
MGGEIDNQQLTLIFLHSFMGVIQIVAAAIATV